MTSANKPVTESGKGQAQAQGTGRGGKNQGRGELNIVIPFSLHLSSAGTWLSEVTVCLFPVFNLKDMNNQDSIMD